MRKVIVEDYTNTWKLITIGATLVSLISMLVFAFYQRSPIIEALTGHKVFVKDKVLRPSEGSRRQLMDFVKTHDSIVAVNIGHADFENNTRESVYNFSKVVDIDLAWKSTQGNKLPLFTDDTMHNSRIVSLVNGQFVCSETKNTIAGHTHPILLSYSKMTCSVPIPPGFGDFVGWINIYLVDTPSFVQLEKLQKNAEDIARDIYQRDVMKGQQQGTSNADPLFKF